MTAAQAARIATCALFLFRGWRRHATSSCVERTHRVGRRHIVTRDVTASGLTSAIPVIASTALYWVTLRLIRIMGAAMLDATVSTPDDPAERPDLVGWRRRHGLRKSSAAQPIPSGKQYERKPKHEQEREQRDG